MSELKSRWFRAQFAELERTRAGAELANMCIALRGTDPMILGMLVGDLVDRPALYLEGLEALRRLVDVLPDAQCDRVFALIAGLPIDVSARRERLLATRRAALEAYVARFADATPLALVEALVDLRAGRGPVLGLELPADPALQHQLGGNLLDHLAARIPTLSDDACEQVFAVIRRARIPLDIAARAAELAARQKAFDDGAVASVDRDEPRHDQLERAIAANPSDVASHTVLADWLQRHGHPRGELIALQLRAESSPGLAATVAAHLAAHAGVLLGPLAAHQRIHDGTGRDAFTWRRGFIRAAHLSHDEHADTDDVRLADILDLLLAHPSGRFLGALTIGMNGASGRSVEDVVAVLVRRAPPSLRTLAIGEPARCALGDLSTLWSAVPGLVRLTLRGTSFVLGSPDLPAVRHVEIEATEGLTSVNACALAEARFPVMRHLDVWLGAVRDGGSASLADVERLLARRDLTELSHLGIKRARFADDLVPLLAKSPLARQLRELDLSNGTLSDAGAAALAAARSAFPNLKQLAISETPTSSRTVAALRRAFAKVVASHADRYERITE